MNTTTFTIESVHGVKQTLVLGILERTVNSQPSKPHVATIPSKPAIASVQAPAPQVRR